jgi:hypothetical protein
MLDAHIIMATDTGSGIGESVASGVIGAALGAIATLLAVVLTPLAQRRDRYDAALLTRRMTSYEALHLVLEPTSRYAEALDRDLDQHALADALTRWYYAGHGLYMTERLRDQFFDLRDRLDMLTRREIGDLASGIRTQMTKDLNSRRPPLLATKER